MSRIESNYVEWINRLDIKTRCTVLDVIRSECSKRVFQKECLVEKQSKEEAPDLGMRQLPLDLLLSLDELNLPLNERLIPCLLGALK